MPFREVYIHALVRDANREKMSKTKGNVIDPIEIVKQYGTDAVRFTLASMASPGTDIAFNVARTEGYRAFANKIWNAARFMFMNVDRAAEVGIAVDPRCAGRDADRGRRMRRSKRDGLWPNCTRLRPRSTRRSRTTASTMRPTSSTSFSGAASATGIWRLSSCGWISRRPPTRRKTKAALTTLVSVFEAALRLLSPFMPFLTEEMWHAVYDGNPPAKSIALTRYPQASEISARGSAASGADGLLAELIVEVRACAKKLAFEEKTVVQSRFA